MVLELLSLSCLASAVAATLWATRRAVSRLPRGEVRCTICLTPGRELSDLVCPKCGHDVREQGLERPTVSPAGTVLRWMLASLAYATLAAIVTTFYVQTRPMRFADEADITWVPRSVAYGIIEQQATRHADRAAVGRGSARWILSTKDGQLGVIEIEVPSLAYRVTDVAGQTLWEGADLNGQAVMKWMQGLGIVMTPEIEAEARELADQAKASMAVGRRGGPTQDTRRFFTGSGGRHSSGYGGYGDSWVLPVPVMAWPVGWALWALGREWFLSRRTGRGGSQRLQMSEAA